MARAHALARGGRGDDRRRRRVGRGRPPAGRRRRRRSRASCRSSSGSSPSSTSSSPSTRTSRAVAEAAVAAGAAIVNDVSGAARPGARRRLRAHRRRARDHAHARAAQGHAARPGRLRRRRAPTCGSFLAERMAAALARAGWGRSRSCSTRGRTSPRRPRRPSRCCAASTSCTRSGRPLLLAVSRKDFLGAITGPRAARARRGDARRRRLGGRRGRAPRARARRGRRRRLPRGPGRPPRRAGARARPRG